MQHSEGGWGGGRAEGGSGGEGKGENARRLRRDNSGTIWVLEEAASRSRAGHSYRRRSRQDRLQLSAPFRPIDFLPPLLLNGSPVFAPSPSSSSSFLFWGPNGLPTPLPPPSPPPPPPPNTPLLMGTELFPLGSHVGLKAILNHEEIVFNLAKRLPTSPSVPFLWVGWVG